MKCVAATERVHGYMTVCMIQLVTEMTEWKSVRPVRFTSELTAEERRGGERIGTSASELQGMEASVNTSLGPKPRLCS